MPALLLIATLLLSGFAPAHNAPSFGTTYTTLNGSDNIKNFPTLYNANNAAFNNSKIEVGSTSIAAITTLPNLSSVGTISTGVWNGSPISVAYNSTGTSSPTLNQIMFGNGASGLKVIGFGNSGQSLVSNGSATPPSWQSVSFDQSLNYNNSGNWIFTGSTYIKGLTASSTPANPINLNGLNYTTPSARAASSTVPMEDGSGNLSFNKQTYSILYNQQAPQNTTATTTVTIPAGTLGNNGGRLVLDWQGTGSGGGGDSLVRVIIGTGSSSTTLQTITNADGSGRLVISATAGAAIAYTGVLNTSGTLTGPLTTQSYDPASKLYIAFVSAPRTGAAIFYTALVTLVSGQY